MSTLYILEGQAVGKTPTSDMQAMQMPYVTLKKVTFTGTAGYSSKINDNTRIFAVWSDAQSSIEISTTSSASVGSNNIILPAGTLQSAVYFSCAGSSGLYLSAISNS